LCEGIAVKICANPHLKDLADSKGVKPVVKGFGEIITLEETAKYLK